MPTKALSAYNTIINGLTTSLSKMRSDWKSLLQDLNTARRLRLSIGATLAMALAYGFNWPLSMLTPMFTVMLLSLPLPRPSLRRGVKNMLQTLVAAAIGVFISLYFLSMPVIFFLVLALILFHTYYFINRGGSFWFTLILLISILLMPMLSQINGGLATGVSIGFVWSSWVAVWILFLAHFLVPDPEMSQIPTSPPMYKGYVPIAAESALKSTIVAFPMAITFIAFQLTDYILVMIFAAIFTLSPDLNKGKEAISNSLTSTLIGGVTAFVFYWTLVAMPEYYFFILLFFFSGAFLFINNFLPTS